MAASMRKDSMIENDVNDVKKADQDDGAYEGAIHTRTFRDEKGDFKRLTLRFTKRHSPNGAPSKVKKAKEGVTHIRCWRDEKTGRLKRITIHFPKPPPKISISKERMAAARRALEQQQREEEEEQPKQ